jgi:hypothetical protein
MATAHNTTAGSNPASSTTKRTDMNGQPKYKVLADLKRYRTMRAAGKSFGTEADTFIDSVLTAAENGWIGKEIEFPTIEERIRSFATIDVRTLTDEQLRTYRYTARSCQDDASYEQVKRKEQ